MLNQYVFAALLAVTTTISTVIVNVSPSYGQVDDAVKFCKKNPQKCLPIKPAVKHGIPAIQRRIDQRQNEQEKIRQELQRRRQQQLQQDAKKYTVPLSEIRKK